MRVHYPRTPHLPWSPGVGADDVRAAGLSGGREAGIADGHAWLRPFETGPAATRFAVGLCRTPPDAVRLAAIAEPWASTLRGVTVAWAPCGGVPPLR
ncbi:hypothetical protein [Actinoallomurus sp. NPDC052274]|uniref:hypothetical protein n=1 Tax=Actinoallomurus sp. NPDC052274 TaxID=3155420 RepID=UPI003412FD31